MSTGYLLFFARKIVMSRRLKQDSKDCAVLPKSLNQAFSQCKKKPVLIVHYFKLQNMALTAVII